MIQTETGTVFIGFTGQLKCEKCGNLTPMHLKEKGEEKEEKGKGKRGRYPYLVLIPVNSNPNRTTA